MGQTNSIQIKNFLESLRENTTTEPIRFKPLEKLTHKTEIQKRRVAEFHQSRTGEWHKLYSAREKANEHAIENIRTELVVLSKNVHKLERNIAQAVSLPVLKPGEYHRSLYGLILDFIKLLNKEVTSTDTWITIYKQRSKKQGYYWQQASRGGTRFTQNNERAIATSVG